MVNSAAPGVAQTPLPPVTYWMVTFGVMCASLIQFLDTTIANVALPHMRASLGASVDSVTWVLTSFIIASAVAIPSGGWIVSRFGTRGPFLAAVSMFILSSMLCGIAANLEQMVAFRFIQGVSAAFIQPIAQSIMLDISPPERHTRALGLWGMTSMIGPVIGPTLGGWLTDNLNWRWVFYINVPVGVPALFILWRLLPRSPPRPRKFDMAGYLLLALALASLQLMLDRGQHKDWFESTEIVIEAFIAACAFWCFLVHTAFTPHPLFPGTLVRNPRLLLATGFSMATAVVMMGILSILPTMLQTLFGYSAIQAGYMMASRSIGILAVMTVIPKLMERFPLRALFVTGFSLVTLSVWQMTSWTLDSPAYQFSLSSLIQGLGLGMLMVPVNYLAYSTIAPELRTDCAVFLNLNRNMAGSISISIFVGVLASSAQTSHEAIGAHVTSLPGGVPPEVLGGFPDLQGLVGQLVNSEVTRQAMMISYVNVFWLILAINLIAIALSLSIRERA